ncbi:hypothetical protein [Listeria cossartiae]|uniref:hypothetical protein n=1 Tax=Listeria cossartiae TaxID=2838249 RepID=UPI001C8CAA71|nr:hypothetical protein [Listeria cossartiae]
MTFLEILNVKLEEKKGLVSASVLIELELIISNYFASIKTKSKFSWGETKDEFALVNKEALSIFFEAFEEYCDELVGKKRLLSVKGIDGAPDWYGYERLIWDSGLTYIEPILKLKKCKDENALLDGLLSLCLESKYGKGRQSLVTLIGKYGAAVYVPSLVPLMDDPEVSIHVIDALTKLKDLSQYEKIKIIAEGKQATPERLYAKKYIKKMAAFKEN